MYPRPINLILGSKRALTASIIVATFALASILIAGPLRGDASASLREIAGALGLSQFESRELAPQWRWERKSRVEPDRMFRQRPERVPRGSFDRVLDMAKKH